MMIDDGRGGKVEITVGTLARVALYGSILSVLLFGRRLLPGRGEQHIQSDEVMRCASGRSSPVLVYTNQGFQPFGFAGRIYSAARHLVSA